MNKVTYIRDMVFDGGLHNPSFAGGKGKYIIYLRATEKGQEFAEEFNVGVNDNVYGCYLTKKEATERLQQIRKTANGHWDKGRILPVGALYSFDFIHPSNRDFTRDH